MSQIALQSNVGGTGIFTIASPNSNTNRTLTIPDETGTFITSASIAASLNATGSAPLYACRAWVNFNGTGVIAIRGSGNVSSITDVSVGNYYINFTTAMPDANYVGVVPTTDNGSLRTAASIENANTTASQISIAVVSQMTNTLTDSARVDVAIFR